MSRLDHRWTNRATYSNREFLRDMSQDFKRRVRKRLGRMLPSIGRMRSRLANVDGFWGDNWMGQTCMVRLKDSVAGDDVQLTGIPTESMELTVLMQKKHIGSFSLQGKKLEDVRFHVEPGEGRQVKLLFSRHFVDGAGRKLSFQLQGTNLFAEQDLAA
jgi:hypothetical protein